MTETTEPQKPRVVATLRTAANAIEMRDMLFPGFRIQAVVKSPSPTEHWLVVQADLPPTRKAAEELRRELLPSKEQADECALRINEVLYLVDFWCSRP